MFTDDQTARILHATTTLAECEVSRAEPYRGNAQRHIGFEGHEREYYGYREVRTFAGFGVSLLKPDRSPLPLYRDKDGALWVGCDDGEQFVVELHVQEGGDRWAARLAVNGEQEYHVPISADSGGSVFHIVTQTRHKGDNIVSDWSQSSGAVQPFVAQSEIHRDTHEGGPARSGVITCTFYGEYHPRRFMSPTLRGPALSGYVAGGKGLVDAREENFIVNRRMNTSVEIRFAPRSEIERLGFTRVQPTQGAGQGRSDLQILAVPPRPASL